MLKGNIYITNDLNDVRNMIATHQVVIIGQPDQQLIMQTGAQIGSILLPPYKACHYEAEGDAKGFYACYGEYLSTMEPSGFIACIIGSLYKGINILLYLTKDESELLYSKVLMEYLAFYYGIVIGNPQQPYMYYNTPEYNAVICNLLYQFELINYQEFFVNYPQLIPIDNNSIMKLIIEINPYLNDTSFESYCAYFNKYKEDMKMSNVFLRNPITKRR